jgi:hypothetical protein
LRYLNGDIPKVYTSILCDVEKFAVQCSGNIYLCCVNVDVKPSLSAEKIVFRFVGGLVVCIAATVGGGDYARGQKFGVFEYHKSIKNKGLG